jgi:hypothetical protein
MLPRLLLSFACLLFIFTNLNVAFQKINHTVSTNDTILSLANLYKNLSNAQQRKVDPNANGTKTLKGKLDDLVNDVKSGVNTQIDNVKNKTNEVVSTVTVKCLKFVVKILNLGHCFQRITIGSKRVPQHQE